MFKRKVLVVDDQQINRKILSKMLSQEYQIILASNGQEALHELVVHPDLSAVILDILMPVLDGYGVIKAMREDSNWAKIPIIVASQNDGEQAELKALSLGANDFISKPYKSKIILRRLENLIKLRETSAMINKAERDELTGLYNKQFFLNKAKEKLSESSPRAYDMLCLGVERFKLINETYGENTGDKVLQHIAQVLQQTELPDAIYGRFMQDEFYIMLPHQKEFNGAIVQQWAKEINTFPIDMEIKIHCGIYVIEGEESSLVNICDSAKMAANKNRGRYDKWYSYYTEELREKLQKDQFILSQMQESLEKGQFKVFYQPKFDLNSELIVGAEALVRWEHPKAGSIAPSEFIPVFEQNGFITVLDKYVWEKVCQDMVMWQEKGYGTLPVSVNVSRVDIYNPKLVDFFLKLIAKYKLSINQLHLEITESAYTENYEQIFKVVEQFRDLGFIVEMDDFGSGYSSLNMLANIPVDVLKLDMQFIQNDQHVRNSKGIMSFVISLARWMNIMVLAEGVENAEQIALLRTLDCNYVQGYYYAKPLALDDFLALLKSAHVADLAVTKAKATMDDYVAKVTMDEKKLRGRVMLIVDDMEANRAALASIFVNEYVIVEKSNGKEAWEYLEEHAEQVDVIMLDIIMPVMDGLTLLNKIKSTANTKHIATIITSQGGSDIERRALELSADDFISKPYKADLIRHRVHNLAPKYVSKELAAWQQSFDDFAHLEETQGLTHEEKVSLYLKAQKPHFDIVRLVQPELTRVCEYPEQEKCKNEFCFSVWGKQTRCNNCVSLKALRTQSRCNKLEYSQGELYFIIAEYVDYGTKGAVVEMVTRLDKEYIDNIFEKDLLYINLDEIQHQIEYDPLTGVYNRRHIDKKLGAYVEFAKKHHKNLGIAMVDIDSFKILNDNLGHLAGDEALKEIAQVLQSNIAVSKGDFVARFGGDEFMIVCRDIPKDVFVQRMNALIKLVGYLELGETGETVPGISLGCVCVEDFPTYSALELIKEADKRLYSAKKMGKNCLVAK